ncbi:MAG: EF-hand domain-containing protein [Candidatus Hydrogenedentes bacterium]|nr:EF-hand domain-containing protein [Candidatus Hydrogenedentota bacterium]
MNMCTKYAVTIGLLLAAVVPASAQDSQTKASKAGGVFQRADANSDGRVTLEELKTQIPGITQERFAVLDRNGDGALSLEDRPTAEGAQRLAARFQKADTNNDQKLSMDEAQKAFPRMDEERFKKADADGDSALTVQEIQLAVAAKIKEADADGNGKISFEEATAAFPRMNEGIFKRMDRNGDGVLSKEDRKEAGQ